MSPKRTVLDALTKPRLIELAHALEAHNGPTGLSKSALVDALARKGAEQAREPVAAAVARRTQDGL